MIRISRASGKLVSWLLYGIAVARESLRHDVIYAFDLTTAGIPSALFSRIFRKPFILRIGGDSLWERVVEKGERSIPMRAYYEQGLFKKDRPTLYRLVRFVVRRADTVVIPCGFLKDLYIRFYGVSAEKITLIQNPFPPKSPAMIEEDTFTFLFAGRFVSYKNLVRVLKVFRDIAEKYPHARLVLIGEGPDEAALKARAALLGENVEIVPKVNQKTLFECINASSVALAPALTEFNSNFILEALALGKPALISRDNGLSANLPDSLQFDPMSDASLQEAMERMLNAIHYHAALSLVAELPMDQTWDKVVSEHAEIVRKSIR
ncbi:hypothetical protein A3C18_03505 [Candidatus Kaiserbacteria bacterium RIFCSPHIGHO2_02_FULL_54_11b]|uniref:Glycosyl transferase family 1 domain-containing protein n=1 Tax=Candidatus Kaiserbacteria bacterium RIFCSPHIGHO2_02_FULL_54_11b TaxID=1798494 RepID=A0A1F6DTD1_9BACT|nr:MAG: hypothetical protein A3C18_03505 [Candidatus Kaiserbacteria bacterium RIFCSPHIGHO2_02_FULL_54_11b]